MIDREALLKGRLGERVVEIPGVGSLRIRSLSGKEVAQLPQYKEGARIQEGEDFVLTTAVVEPALSAADVAAWREAAGAGEIFMVLSEIFDLSGLGEDSLKEAVQSFRSGPGEAL